jgi:hypothetical protein
MPHILGKIGADGVKFAAGKWQKFNNQVDAIQISGER